MSATDWIVTMPTKRFYTATGSGTATKLFQRNFNGVSGSCDDLQLLSCYSRSHIYDREERTLFQIFCGSTPPAGST